LIARSGRAAATAQPETSREYGCTRFNVFVLVERAAAMGVLEGALDFALRGTGGIVFVGGEAGIGKTALVTEFVARVGDRGPKTRVVIRRGACDHVSANAAVLGALVEAVPELAPLAENASARPALVRAARDALTAEPTLLVLEDLHWADGATLDVLRHLGRRLAGTALLVVATFREDEVTRTHPLTTVLGDLATAPGARRVSLARLSVDGVRQLVESRGVAAFDIDDLHRRTAGNPFFVTEVLAASQDAVPASVRDVVLTRVARLDHAAQRILAAAAVLGARAELDQLTAVAQQPPTAVDTCVTAGMLVADAPGWSFRHELAREAVAGQLPPGDLAQLHRRAYAALSQDVVPDDRCLAYHSDGARDRRATLVHAERAAIRADQFGAHREAAEQYRLALRAEPRDAVTRRRLCEALSYQCYLTDQPEEALAARRRALELAEVQGDPEAVGASLRWVSRLSWFLGRSQESRRYGERAVAVLEPLGDGHELAMAYSNLAQLTMLARDSEATKSWGARALDLARRIGDVEVEIHALNNVGTVLTFDAATVDEGRAMLHRSLDLAVATEAEEHAARAWTNLGSSALDQHEHAYAQATLGRGIAYCEERDLDSWRWYMLTAQAASLAEQGRVDEAEAITRSVLMVAHLSPISAVRAYVVAARIAGRAGRDAGTLIADAQRIAELTGESSRLVSVASVAAEGAWLRGHPAQIPALLERAWTAASARPDPWHLGELAWWARLGGMDLVLPGPPAAPFAAMLTGEWTAAAELWTAHGCPVWAALALAGSPELHDARRALELAETASAPAVAARIRTDRQALGLPLPRGPRATTRHNPASLSARELDVLTRLVAGASNADIAASLFLSEKTVGHHVSAILRKLGQPSRARAAAVAVQQGIVSPPTIATPT
jgi:DNA-binding CsgD family transcriptional regulator/tetratricopeptide (TPR) repeat protein